MPPRNKFPTGLFTSGGGLYSQTEEVTPPPAVEEVAPPPAPEETSKPMKPAKPKAAKSQNRSSAKVQKDELVSQGVQMRASYLYELKMLALKEHKKLYELMDEMIGDYLKKKGQG